jgi:O-antigen/teichoic acid export membrane protein
MMTPPPAAPEGGPKMGRNVSILASAQLITWTMTLLWTLVVPRALGPSGLGTIMAAWSITGILGVVLGLGTRNYLVRESVVRPDSAPGLIGTALILRIVLSPLLIVAAVVYGELVGWTGDAQTVLYLAAAATLFVQIAEPLQAGFQATERMEYLAYSDIISKSGQGLVGIVIVLLGFGTVGVTACWAVMTGVVVVLDLYWLRGLVRIDWRTNVRRMTAVARASLPYWAFGLFFMLYLWIDFVMLSLLTSDEVVGWYAVPTRLFQTLMFLPVAVATAWLPHFVRGFEESDEKLKDAARQPVELVLLLSLPIAALTAAAADPVINLLYGSEYANSVPVMAILGLCIPAMYMNIMLSQVLIAMNRQSTWTWVMAVTTVVNPLFNLALIPLAQHRWDNGAIGAAISLLLTEIVVVAAGVWLIGRRVFDGGSVRRAALGLVAATASGLVTYFGEGVVGWVPALALGILAFVVAAAALRVFTAEEIELIRQGLRKMANKIPGLKRRFGTGASVAPEEPLRPPDGSADVLSHSLGREEGLPGDAASEAEGVTAEGFGPEAAGTERLDDGRVGDGLLDVDEHGEREELASRVEVERDERA